jgi:hypothetical protein
LSLPLSDVSSYTDSTTLVGDHLAQRSARIQSGEFLGAVDLEGNRLDFHAIRHALVANGSGQLVAWGRCVHKWLAMVGVHFVFDTLKEGEFQPVPSLMPHRQIGEDEVACLLWSV